MPDEDPPPSKAPLPFVIRWMEKRTEQVDPFFRSFYRKAWQSYLDRFGVEALQKKVMEDLQRDAREGTEPKPPTRTD